MKRIIMLITLILSALPVYAVDYFDLPFAYIWKRWWVRQYRVHIEQLPLGIVLAMEIREDWKRDGKI